MARPFVAIVLMALGLTASGCNWVDDAPDDGPICTLIGCESHVRFELTALDLEPGSTYDVEVCLDDRCESATVDIPGLDAGPGAAGGDGSIILDPTGDTIVLVLPDGDYGGRHAASLRLVGPDGENVELDGPIEFERLQPNGPDCAPVCWQAVVRI